MMNPDNMILVCPQCGTKNKVPLSRIDESARCGRCKAALPLDSLNRPVVVSDRTFASQVLASPMPVLVDCWAPWCGPCRAIGPMMEELALTYKGRLKIAKLNLDENSQTGARYSITSVPTLLLIRNGQVVDKVIGAVPREQLEARILNFI